MKFDVKVVVLSGSADQKLLEWDPINLEKDSIKKVVFLSYLDGFRYGALHYNQEWTQFIELVEDNRIGFHHQRDKHVRKLHNARFENLEGDHAFLLGEYNNKNVLEMRELVESRLQTYSLEQDDVGGDGNCLYRSLSHIENNKNEDKYAAVKTKIIKQLTEHPEIYWKFVYGDYIKRISMPFAFADNPVLRAYCDVSDYRVASVGPTPFEVLYEFSPGGSELKNCTKDIFLTDLGYHNNPVYFQSNIEAWLKTFSAPPTNPDSSDMFALTPSP